VSRYGLKPGSSNIFLSLNSKMGMHCIYYTYTIEEQKDQPWYA